MNTFQLHQMENVLEIYASPQAFLVPRKLWKESNSPQGMEVQEQLFMKVNMQGER